MQAEDEEETKHESREHVPQPENDSQAIDIRDLSGMNCIAEKQPMEKGHQDQNTSTK